MIKYFTKKYWQELNYNMKVLGQARIDNKLLTKELSNLMREGKLSDYVIDIDTIKPIDSFYRHYRAVSIHNLSKTLSFKGYSVVKILGDVRVALGNKAL